MYPERTLAKWGQLVLVQPQDGEHYQGEVNLSDFQHAQDATYVFGPSHRPLDPYDVSRCVYPFDAAIYIGGGEWLASHAAAIVLYDRAMKL